MIFFAREYNYKKTDIEELTVMEKSQMYYSKEAIYYKKVENYTELSRFATLGLWIIQMVGGDKEKIEDLIGEYPSLEADRELTQEDLDIIEMCKRNDLNYKITDKGIKVST